MNAIRQIKFYDIKRQKTEYTIEGIYNAKIIDLIKVYRRGISNEHLKLLWGGNGLSRSSISKANNALEQSFLEWKKRDLSNEDIVYIFLDGYYCGARIGTKDKEAILITHGITRDGKRVLLSVHLGGVESSNSWKWVINDLNERGLKQPQLVISDGNKGLQRALKDL